VKDILIPSEEDSINIYNSFNMLFIKAY